MPSGTKPPIPVGTAKAVGQGTYGPATWANVFYFAVGSFDPAHLNDVVTLIGNAVAAFYSAGIGYANFPGNWSVTTTKIFFRDASDSLYRATVADAHAGTNPGTSEAAQVAYLFNWTSNDDRRGGKPRTYVEGVIKENLADSARLSSSVITGLNSTMSAWLASLGGLSSGTASGLELLEMSFINGKAYRDAAHTWPIRAVSVSPEVATQRRRVDRLRT